RFCQGQFTKEGGLHVMDEADMLNREIRNRMWASSFDDPAVSTSSGENHVKEDRRWDEGIY
ncbi:MAG TPA: hypothetical protein VMH23_01710, partial [Bacteroidota bacterium]|nr:hypothetical protein [Bacteroidota bacterium]